LAGIIAELGTFGTGPASISIGKLLIVLRRSRPFSNPEIFINGNLQKYGSTICLVAYGRIHSWMIRREVISPKKMGYELIPDMIHDLSFKMALDLSQEISAKTWVGFKYFTKSLEEYQRYVQYGNMEALKCAHKNCIKALIIEHDYDPSIKLLYNIGVAYLNNEKYHESKKVFRQILMFDDDFADAWHGLGKALRRLHRYGEAVKCYDMAIERGTKSAGLMTSKGHSLRHLGNYYLALHYFREGIKIDDEYSLAWAGKALVLNCLAEKETDSKWIRESIESYEKAAELGPDDPDKAMYAPARARLYSERNKNGDDAKKKKCCNDARKFADELSDYNRTCFEASCGEKRDALKWLKKALRDGKANPYWAEKDPDLKTLHGKEFEEIIAKAKCFDYARKFADELSDYNRACFESSCGKKRDALKWLKKALQDGKANPYWAEIDPDLKPLHGNEFEELIAKAKLSDYNRACFETSCGEKRDALKWLKKALENEKVDPYWVEIDPKLKLLHGEEFGELIAKAKAIYSQISKTEDHETKDMSVEISEIAIHRMLKYETEAIDQKCEEIRKNIQKELEYTRACYYAVCDKGVENALKYLKIALKKKQVSPDEVRADPDLISIRDNYKFIDIINKFSKDN